jgi:four helix bundle protein
MNRDDLEQRTLKFVKNLIELLNSLPRNIINDRIVGQCFSSGSSIGANYREANGAESKKDFKHKISISLKESKETKYWLEVSRLANSEKTEKIDALWTEVDEFAKIFGKIVSTCEKNEK